jgi:hypothetical protein
MPAIMEFPMETILEKLADPFVTAGSSIFRSQAVNKARDNIMKRIFFIMFMY